MAEQHDQIVEKDLHEIPANRRILDVRPWHVKAREWLSFKENYAFAVVILTLFPLTFPVLTLPVLLTIIVLTGVNRSIRAVMPLRYPAGSFDVAVDKKGKESRPVPGTDKNADGILMLGNLESSSIAARGRELWLADDDLRKHLLILGATGSGKSETLKAICYNALCWSSGFFIADGKADNKLATDAYTLTRRFGVDDNFLVLNFLLGGSTPQQVAASRRRRSNSLNPFRTSDEDTIIQMGANLLPKAEGEGKQWQEKALSLWRGMVKALCYKRDHEGFELSIDVFLEYLALDKIEELYIEGYDRRDPDTLEWPYGFLGIKAYLESGLPGFSVEKLLRKHNRIAAPTAAPMPQMGRGGAQSNDQAPASFEQHSYRANQLQPALGLLAYTYGHIFGHRYPEIDIVDVVLNDRVLLTLIPPLEKSSQEAENLGKLAIACLRVMMARNLGTEIEGTREELIDSKATAAAYPYVVALDELGYYFADGIAVMFAQARSLGFMMIALAQDLEKLTEGSRSAEAGAMMGNQVGKMFMRIDDAQKTWNLIKEVLGKVPVAVVKSFSRKGSRWEDSNEAGIELVEPVTLRQFQAMQAGEGILSTQGERLHFRSLYVAEALSASKTFRLNRFLQVRPPSQEAIDQYSEPLDVQADPIEKGRRMMDILRGESSVEYQVQPDHVLSALAQTASSLPREMSSEVRGVVLYMAAKAAIEKAKQAASTTPQPEQPVDAAQKDEESDNTPIDLGALAQLGAEVPFMRKEAQPIVTLLQGEVDAGGAGGVKAAAKPNDPLAMLGLIPGMGDATQSGSPTVEPDENPDVWKTLPFKRRSEEAAHVAPAASSAVQQPAQPEPMPVAAPAPVEALPAKAEPQLLPASMTTPPASAVSEAAARAPASEINEFNERSQPIEGLPSFEQSEEVSGEGFGAIEGFDVVPSTSNDMPGSASLLEGLGAFPVPVQPVPAAAVEPAQTVTNPPASTSEAWNASMGRAFVRLLALDDEDRVDAAADLVRDIPLDEAGRVDIPVDDQGLMIGMSDGIADRVRTLEALMGHPSTDVSIAALEAEIAIQVTPPVAEVSDDAGEQMSEDEVGDYFRSLAESLKPSQ